MLHYIFLYLANTLKVVYFLFSALYFAIVYYFDNFQRSKLLKESIIPELINLVSPIRTFIENNKELLEKAYD